MDFHAINLTGMGLGNRLKNIASSIRLKESNDKLIIWWPLNNSLNVSFKSLFNIEEILFEERNDWLPEEIGLMNYNLCNEPKTYAWWRLWTKEVTPGFCRDYQLQKEYNSGALIDLEYNRIPQDVIDIYYPIFKKIKPNKEIQSRVLQIPTPTIAMHIRNNDDDWKDRNKPLSLSGTP